LSEECFLTYSFPLGPLFAALFSGRFSCIWLLFGDKLTILITQVLATPKEKKKTSLEGLASV
jgi:hypothetical protein